MKKYISIYLAILMIITCSAPFTVFAADNTEDNAYFTQEEFETFEHIYAVNITPYTTGLIIDKNLGIAKDGAILKITGKTEGNSEVVKCGFTKVVIQRKKSSSTSWSNYKTYDDLYSESTKYNLSKSLTVEKGYQYRVTATHYAKKSLLSTQKIDSTTGSLTF